MFLFAVTQASSPRDHELVQGEHPAVRRLQRRDRLVVLVDDDVFAAFGRAGVRDDALPPGERRLAFVGLQAQVGGDDLFRHGLEPDRLQVAVEDQRPALADHRRFVEVVEVRGEDVAGRELRSASVGWSVRIFGGCSDGAVTKL